MMGHAVLNQRFVDRALEDSLRGLRYSADERL